MLPTPAQGELRPQTGRLHRVRRVAIVAGVTAALVGGGLTAVTAAPASAATHKTKASLTLSISDTSYKKGARPTVHVSSKLHGKATSGYVNIRVSTKLVKHVKLSHGKASYRLSGHLSATTHTVTATVHPYAKGTTFTVRHKKVHVYKYGSRVVNKAVKYTGVHYVYGGTTPRGFDCSGFTRYVYKKETGKTLPRTSSGQHHAGKIVSKKHAKPGDLVYTPGHVAIYVGGNKIIDAPRPGKSIHVRSMWSASWTFIHVTKKANTI